MAGGDVIGYESLASYDASERFAALMDKRDPLACYRDEFLFPRHENGEAVLYMAGNSLGLQPVKTRKYVLQELNDWADMGVEGHFHAKHPWLPYHENLTAATARLVGGLQHEVVVMNSLTVNLHLMMVTFYRPQKSRYKILVEGNAFPSDQYAVASQAQFHGYDPEEAVIEVKVREGETYIRSQDILSLIESEGESIALVMLGSCNYLNGQAFDIPAIAKAAHKMGCMFGVNLAHGAGNLDLHLHDWDVDFAVWCSYKYLNAGPGGIAGCFVHDKYAAEFELPRFAGWWGHDKETRFLMGPSFQPITGAEGWQLSNPPILQLASLLASMEIFDRAGMAAIRKKGDLLTGFLEFLLETLLPKDYCRVITPKNIKERGCQLSLKFSGRPKELVKKLKAQGAICDFREPDIIRAAPAPLYNSFSDVYRFVNLIAEFAGK